MAVVGERVALAGRRGNHIGADDALLRARRVEESLDQLDQSDLVMVNVDLVAEEVAQVVVVGLAVAAIAIATASASSVSVLLLLLVMMAASASTSAAVPIVIVIATGLGHVELSPLDLLTLRPKRLGLLTERRLLTLLALRLLIQPNWLTLLMMVCLLITVGRARISGLCWQRLLWLLI